MLNLDDAIKPNGDMCLPDPQHSDNEIIRQLAALNLLEYEKVRVEKSKALGVRPSVLDAEVKAVRNAGKEAGRLPFANIESHPEPIDPAQLLDEVSDVIRKFIVLDEHQAQAAALWCTSLM